MNRESWLSRLLVRSFPLPRQQTQSLCEKPPASIDTRSQWPSLDEQNQIAIKVKVGSIFMLAMNRLT